VVRRQEKCFQFSAEIGETAESLFVFLPARALHCYRPKIRRVLQTFFWRGDSRYHAHRFANKAFPTKHTKDTKAFHTDSASLACFVCFVGNFSS